MPQQPVVWITGASRGMGREIAKQFASIGCRVCVSARSVNQLTALVKEITRLGGTAHSFPCDISRVNEIGKTAKAIRSRVGEIDVLVCNAGITAFKSFHHTSLDEFKRILDTNLIGSIACIKSVVPSMMRRKKGWIFNIVSQSAIATFKYSSAYTATKAGMLGVGRVLREELKTYNIKVVNVLPGATNTPIWRSAVRKQYGHRMMSPKSVAEAILEIYELPDDVIVDEIVLRPMLGNID
jgi:short-subunit dehydrogenase